MDSLYSQEHRDLQAAFGTEKLADFLDQFHVHADLTEEDQAFIAARDMVFLSTVDPEGNPTVSYKGGSTGFVQVVDNHTLAFPGYDGNGMFLSMGNIAGQGKVGLLFIDLEKPNRLRVQGVAHMVRDDPLRETWPEAQYVVRIEVTKAWVNCPRYIHTYRKVATSRSVPDPGTPTPLATWKRLDILQDALPAEDRMRAAAEGLLDVVSYGAKVELGEA